MIGDVAVFQAEGGVRRFALFRRAGHILHGGKVHQHLPVPGQRRRRLTDKPDQLEQPRPVALGGEDELIPFAPAQGEMRLGKGAAQRALRQFFRLVLLPRVLQAAHLLLPAGKLLPCLGGAALEGPLEPGQGETAAAVVDELAYLLPTVELGRIAGMQFQRPLQIGEGRALPVQIIAGIAHAEVPAVRVGAVGLVGGHQPNGPPQQLTAFRLGGLSQIVVGPGQFHIGGGGALLFGQRFQRLDDLLVFLRLMPQAALFQKVHGGAVLLFCPQRGVYSNFDYIETGGKTQWRKKTKSIVCLYLAAHAGPLPGFAAKKSPEPNGSGDFEAKGSEISAC